MAIFHEGGGELLNSKKLSISGAFGGGEILIGTILWKLFEVGMSIFAQMFDFFWDMAQAAGLSLVQSGQVFKSLLAGSYIKKKIVSSY